MIQLYEKINNNEKLEFAMPLSLRIIKEASQYNLEWKSLHIVDLFSIIYSIRIDNAKKYLEMKRKERLHQRGISEVRKASIEDFDKL